MNKNKNNDIDNEEVLKVLLRYQKKPNKRDYEYLGYIFYRQTEKLLYSPSFVNYTQDIKDEMRSEAYYNLVRYFKNFSREKSSNPFSFFTTIIYHSFQKILNDFKKKRDNEVTMSFIDNLNESNDKNGDYQHTYKIDENYIENKFRQIISGE